MAQAAMIFDLEKAPAKIKNSAIKLFVPGKANDDKEKKPRNVT
jgi:hypothetical protein